MRSVLPAALAALLLTISSFWLVESFQPEPAPASRWEFLFPEIKRLERSTTLTGMKDKVRELESKRRKLDPELAQLSARRERRDQLTSSVRRWEMKVAEARINRPRR